MPEPGERAFLERLRRLPLHPGARGLADDCAVVPLGSETLVVTHDMMAESVHWLPSQDPVDIAWKLVAVNLSDLAAKGAEPVGVLLGYSLQGGDADDAFQIGLSEALSAFSAPLLGGDTICWKGAVHGLTALGRATHLPVPSRGGAQPGDTLWVTGTIGAALAGFEALKAGDTWPASAPYRRPVPLLAEGRALAPLVSAMMDVSDGLLLDAARLAAASGLMAEIDLRAIPLSNAFIEIRGEDRSARLFAATGGDDYALLFSSSVPEETLRLSLPIGPKLTAIGRLVPGEGLALVDGDEPVPVPEHLGYEHRGT